jgi:hypothetical protein
MQSRDTVVMDEESAAMSECTHIRTGRNHISITRQMFTCDRPGLDSLFPASPHNSRIYPRAWRQDSRTFVDEAINPLALCAFTSKIRSEEHLISWRE